MPLALTLGRHHPQERNSTAQRCAPATKLLARLHRIFYTCGNADYLLEVAAALLPVGRTYNGEHGDADALSVGSH